MEPPDEQLAVHEPTLALCEQVVVAATMAEGSQMNLLLAASAWNLQLWMRQLLYWLYILVTCWVSSKFVNRLKLSF